MIGRDRSTSGTAPRTLRWNGSNRDRGFVDIDFQDWSTSTLDWSMSTNRSVVEGDTDLAKASGAACCISPALGKSLGRNSNFLISGVDHLLSPKVVRPSVLEVDHLLSPKVVRPSVLEVLPRD